MSRVIIGGPITLLQETPLGWCALVATRCGVVALRLGFSDSVEAGRWTEEFCQKIRDDSGHRSARNAADTWWPLDRVPKETLLEESDLRSLGAQVAAYLNGCPCDFFEVPIDWPRVARTPFQHRVLTACRQIGYGQTCTYGQLAARVGFPKAARAVGSVMRRNPVPLIIPCHRILGARGALVGYSGPGGVRLKEALLKMEQRAMEGVGSPDGNRLASAPSINKIPVNVLPSFGIQG
jgi:methylated-DNA-[protein]-cysteine S-methyltransferase